MACQPTITQTRTQDGETFRARCSCGHPGIDTLSRPTAEAWVAGHVPKARRTRAAQARPKKARAKRR